MQRRSKPTFPFDVKSAGPGLYLYRGILNYNDFKPDTGHVVPGKRQLSETIKSVLTSDETTDLANEILENTSEIIGMSLHAFEHHSIQGPGTASRMIANQLRRNHYLDAIEPRKERAFLSPHPITINELREAHTSGCVIEQKIQARDSAYLELHANVWIVSMQDPSSVQEKGAIDAEQAFVFFTERDAKRFARNAQHYIIAKRKQDVIKFSTPHYLTYYNISELSHYKEIILTLREKTRYMQKDEVASYLHESYLEEVLLTHIHQLSNTLIDLFDSEYLDLKKINSHLSAVVNKFKTYMILCIANSNRFTNETTEELQGNISLLPIFTSIITLTDHMVATQGIQYPHRVNNNESEKEDAVSQKGKEKEKEHEYKQSSSSYLARDNKEQKKLTAPLQAIGITQVKLRIQYFLQTHAKHSINNLFPSAPLSDLNIARRLLIQLSELETRCEREYRSLDNTTRQLMQTHSLLGIVNMQINHSSSCGDLREELEKMVKQLQITIENCNTVSRITPSPSTCSRMW